jgi:hypothetical protein
MLLLLVFMLCMQSAHAFERRGEVVNEFDHSPTVKPIVSRILSIDPAQYTAAFQLLEQRKYLRISDEQLNQILLKIPDDQALIDKEIDDSIAYAEQREREAAIPFLAQSKKWMIDSARLHREHAAYLRSIKNGLNPYLVRTDACYANGGYNVNIDLRHHSLQVTSICMGRGPVVTKPVPIIIFVETSVQAVELGVAAIQ